MAKISTLAEYEAAIARLNAIGVVVDGNSPSAAERERLLEDIRRWREDCGEADNASEGNHEPGISQSADDLPFAGLPGSLGKLHRD